jgi:hypothetical protein
MNFTLLDGQNEYELVLLVYKNETYEELVSGDSQTDYGLK